MGATRQKAATPAIRSDEGRRGMRFGRGVAANQYANGGPESGGRCGHWRRVQRHIAAGQRDGTPAGSDTSEAKVLAGLFGRRRTVPHHLHAIYRGPCRVRRNRRDVACGHRLLSEQPKQRADRQNEREKSFHDRHDLFAYAGTRNHDVDLTDVCFSIVTMEVTRFTGRRGAPGANDRLPRLKWHVDRH